MGLHNFVGGEGRKAFGGDIGTRAVTRVGNTQVLFLQSRTVAPVP